MPSRWRRARRAPAAFSRSTPGFSVTAIVVALPSAFRRRAAGAYGRKRSRSSSSLIGQRRMATTVASMALSAPSGVVVMTVTRSPVFAPIERAEPAAEHHLVGLGIGEERSRRHGLRRERGALLERGDRPRAHVADAPLPVRDESEEGEPRHRLDDVGARRDAPRSAPPSPRGGGSRPRRRSSRPPSASRTPQVPPLAPDRHVLQAPEGLRHEAGRHRGGDVADDDDAPGQDRPTPVAEEVPRREAPPAEAHAAPPATCSSETIRPSTRRIRRRARSMIRGSWLEKRNAIPFSAWSSSKRSRRRAAVSESSDAVGSSARTSAGSPTSARATATLCRCPPESASGRRSSKPARPTAARAARARVRHSSSGRPRIQSAKATFSSAERTGIELVRLEDEAERSRRSRARPRSSSVETSFPSKTRRPASGRSRRPRRFRRVVFPLPEGPARTANSPASRSKRRVADADHPLLAEPVDPGQARRPRASSRRASIGKPRLTPRRRRTTSETRNNAGTHEDDRRARRDVERDGGRRPPRTITSADAIEPTRKPGPSVETRARAMAPGRTRSAETRRIPTTFSATTTVTATRKRTSSPHPRDVDAGGRRPVLVDRREQERPEEGRRRDEDGRADPGELQEVDRVDGQDVPEHQAEEVDVRLRRS